MGSNGLKWSQSAEAHLGNASSGAQYLTMSAVNVQISEDDAARWNSFPIRCPTKMLRIKN